MYLQHDRSANDCGRSVAGFYYCTDSLPPDDGFYFRGVDSVLFQNINRILLSLYKSIVFGRFHYLWRKVLPVFAYAHIEENFCHGEGVR